MAGLDNAADAAAADADAAAAADEELLGRYRQTIRPVPQSSHDPSEFNRYSFTRHPSGCSPPPAPAAAPLAEADVAAKDTVPEPGECGAAVDDTPELEVGLFDIALPVVAIGVVALGGEFVLVAPSLECECSTCPWNSWADPGLCNNNNDLDFPDGRDSHSSSSSLLEDEDDD